jgi:hypothetical protein
MAQPLPLGDHRMNSTLMPWSRLVLALCTVVLAAWAGAVLSSGPLDGPALLRLGLAICGAMACGVAAALNSYRDLERRGTGSTDNGDPTIEIGIPGVPGAAPAPAYGPLKILGGFIGAAGMLVAIAAVGLLWSRASVPTEATSASPAELAADSSEPTPSQPTALQNASAVPIALATSIAPGHGAVRAVLRSVDASRARRECLAQVESAHLFLGLARQAESAGAYTRSTNPQIKRMLDGRPVDPRTLQHIALRMWEQRSAPDRGPQWWSAQYARCEQALMAGSSYVVRG